GGVPYRSKAPSALSSRSAQGEALSRGPVAVPDLQPGAVAGGPAGRVETAAGLRVEQRTVGLLPPDLPADAVAVPQLHLGTDGRAVADDVQTPAERAQRAVGAVVPVLVDRVGLAVPELHLGTGGGAVADDVEAAAEGTQRVVGEVFPVLVLGPALAVPQLHRGAVAAGVVGRHVHALPAWAGDGVLRAVGHVGLPG